MPNSEERGNNFPHPLVNVLERMEGPLRVFAYPKTLEFYQERCLTRQLIICNPYSFPVKFSVYTNNASKFKVDFNHRCIYPKSYVILSVAYINSSEEDLHKPYLLKIKFFDVVESTTLGKANIVATLFPDTGTAEIDLTCDSLDACAEDSINSSDEPEQLRFEPQRNWFLVLSFLLVMSYFFYIPNPRVFEYTQEKWDQIYTCFSTFAGYVTKFRLF
ncbi:hypothetical protein MTP99_013655 [Tenebrio molitor]|nr:hypothetical protein MTP99_013655 [Tenebrio molitor]